MKYLLVLALAIFSVVSSKEQYSTEHDDFDLEPILKDKAQLQAFASCFNDKAPCADIPAHFKKDLLEAIKQNCDKCTSAQKHLLKRFLEELKLQMPAEYEDFKQKYDPEGKNLPGLEG